MGSAMIKSLIIFLLLFPLLSQAQKKPDSAISKEFMKYKKMEWNFMRTRRSKKDTAFIRVRKEIEVRINFKRTF